MSEILNRSYLSFQNSVIQFGRRRAGRFSPSLACGRRSSIKYRVGSQRFRPQEAAAGAWPAQRLPSSRAARRGGGGSAESTEADLVGLQGAAICRIWTLTKCLPCQRTTSPVSES